MVRIVKLGLKRPVVRELLPDPKPREVKYTFISVDDHLMEPPHTFEGRLPRIRGPGAEKLSVFAKDEFWRGIACRRQSGGDDGPTGDCISGRAAPGHWFGPPSGDPSSGTNFAFPRSH